LVEDFLIQCLGGGLCSASLVELFTKDANIEKKIEKVITFIGQRYHTEYYITNRETTTYQEGL